MASLGASSTELAKSTLRELEQDSRRGSPSLTWIVIASSLGSLIEWYDFYLYGSLAVFLGGEFFPPGDKALAVLLSVLTMGMGFAIRPIGGIVFGLIGDRVGRKYTFLVSLVLMGAATTGTGLLPTYATLGVLSPILLLAVRLVQGLAVGGELGGAMTYVVENAPERRRGLYTGILNVMGTFGTILSLLVVVVCRTTLGVEAFRTWGWRLPFLVSAVLVVLSLYLRLSLKETPIFAQLKATGRTSRTPLREIFLDRRNLRTLLIATFGVTAGQSVMGITSNVYATQFMQAVLKIDLNTASGISAVALLLSVPVYISSGWLSDKIGRRKIMLSGMFCAIVCYIPIYMLMRAASHPVNVVALCGLCWLQLAFTALIVGPTFAYLTELFPARIRTTSVTIPFNIGNGVIGGFSPFIALWLTSATGVAYMGLFYPIAVLILTVTVNLIFVRETYLTRIWDEVK
jgi:MFS family permease